MKTPTSHQRILLIEDDREIAALIAELLQDEGFATAHADSVESGLALLAHEPFALILTDGLAEQTQPERRWTAVEQILAAAGGAPVLICTAHDPGFFAGATERGFAAVLNKPFDLDDLLVLIARLTQPDARPPGLGPDTRSPGAAPGARSCEE